MPKVFIVIVYFLFFFISSEKHLCRHDCNFFIMTSHYKNTSSHFCYDIS